MKVAIMQPYFFPYLGYWQLLNAVDTFVILDDVNYIKKGYINSNSIIINNRIHKFTISLENPSQNKLICETKLFFPINERERFLKTITMAYKRAPFFYDFFPVFSDILLFEDNDLTNFIKYSFDKVKEYLGIDTSILMSSKIQKDNSLKGESRIIDINKRIGSDIYINAIGGRSLYSYDNFEKEGICLKFINMLPHTYRQFGEEFVPNMSFIDVLMHNSIYQVRELLSKYELV